ncbi:MAG: hypothetical protein HY902_18865 [Deltaproteobacteria bacterium]|nr:hypothetical protein [Deltaproteobacteria bacterium]
MVRVKFTPAHRCLRAILLAAWLLAAVPGWAAEPDAAVSPAVAATPAGSGPALELEPDDGAVMPPSVGVGQPNDNDARAAMYRRTSLLDNIASKLGAVHNKTTVGGYGEHEFVRERGRDSYFNAHRYVLFFYSQIHPRITTSTEFEIEFGGSPAKRDGQQQAGEAILEFSVVDFMVTHWLTLRAGIILVPFGAYNLRHDAPTQDLTERPLALTTITPSTWFETGAGALGKIELGEQTVSYEVYAINGLDAKLADGLGTKGAVGSKGEDNNDDKGLVGRLAWAPNLKWEFAASGYTGAYDDQRRRIHMLSADLTARLGRVEFQGEYVRAFIDRGYVQGFSAGSPANTRVPVPTGMQGWYLQSNVHFTVPWLWQYLPADLSDSVMTAILRVEQADTDMAVRNHHDVDKLTVGLNYRPIEGYVWKNELQLVSNGAGGVRHDLFSGNWEFTPKYVTSVAFLF